MVPFTVPNIGLQKEIAQKSRNDLFSRISFDFVDGKYNFKGKLYRTDSGKGVLELNTEDADPYNAIDKLTAQIFNHYSKELEGQKKQISMPASTMISSNEKALENYTTATTNFFKDPSKSVEIFTLSKKAIEQDPTCSSCHLMAGVGLYFQQKSKEAIPYVRDAIKYGASLPKRYQFWAKEMYYAINGDNESYIKLLELRKNMFPYDFAPYETLKNLYLINKGIDSTKVLLNEAIDNGNVEKGLLALYDVELNSKQYDEAENTLKRLTSEFPGREQDKRKFADVYQRQGKLNKAKKVLMELEALNPLDTKIQTDLAYLEFKNTEVNAAMARINEGIEQASTMTDSLNFTEIRSFFYRGMGEVGKALQSIADYENLLSKKMPRANVLQSTFRSKTYLYLSVGENGKVNELIDEISAFSPNDTSVYRCFAQEIRLSNGFGSELNQNVFLACISYFKDLGQGFENRFKLMNYFLSGELNQCIEILQAGGTELENRFSDNFLSYVYEKAERFDKAKELIQVNIDEKTDNPLYYLRMAELLVDKNPEVAKKHLQTALEYWSQADKDYIPFQSAKKLEAKLAQS